MCLKWGITSPYQPCLISALILRLLCLKKLLKIHSFLLFIRIFKSTRSDKKHERVLPDRHTGSNSELPLTSCVIQPHLQQPLLFQSEVSSKHIADADKLRRDFAIWAITHWTIDLETTKLIYRSNETVRHIISTKLCTGLPINAAQWSLVR